MLYTVQLPPEKEKAPMTNLGKILKQAQELPAKMAVMQEKLAELEVTGAAAGGMVRVTLNGKGEAKKLSIDPSVVKAEDTSLLEDLILAAFHAAKAEQAEAAREMMSEVTGGLPLPPGMQLPF